MRKRLVIGAIATVVIGVAAYVPGQGSVEYHRRKHAEWENGKIDWLVSRVPWFVQRVYLQERENRLTFHGEALRKVGYTNDLVVLRD